MQEFLIRPAVDTEATEINELIGLGRIETYMVPEQGLNELWATRMMRYMRAPTVTQRTAHEIRRAQSQPAKVLFSVAETASGLAGVIYAHRDEQAQWLQRLFVGKQFQRQGLGRLLMGEFFDWHDPGMPTSLQVAIGNDNAKQFYDQFGFAQVEGWEGMNGQVRCHMMILPALAEAATFGRA